MNAQCPEICICVRRTLDWGDAEAVRTQLHPEFRPKLEAWNATFNLPYPAFRQRLKEIAELNLSHVADVTFVKPGLVPEGALVVPVDDDDWFAPDLATHLRQAYEPKYIGYYWTPFNLEFRRSTSPLGWLLDWPRPLKPQLEPRRYTCTSNNHAVIESDVTSDLRNYHGNASRYFDNHRDLVKRLPLLLSIQNRNISSQTALNWRQPTITPARLRKLLRRSRQLYRHPILPPELAWSHPYIEMMARLVDELRVN